MQKLPFRSFDKCLLHAYSMPRNVLIAACNGNQAQQVSLLWSVYSHGKEECPGQCQKPCKLSHDLRSNWFKDSHTEEQSPMEGKGDWGPLWNKGRAWSSTRTQDSVVLTCQKGNLDFDEGSGRDQAAQRSSVEHTEIERGVDPSTKSYYMRVWESLNSPASTVTSSGALWMSDLRCRVLIDGEPSCWRLWWVQTRRVCMAVVKGMSPGGRKPGLESQLCHAWARQLWASGVISVFRCKMSMIIIESNLLDCCDY